MGFLLLCLLVGLVVLYKPVRRIIFQGVWATIVGAVVIIILIIAILMISGWTPIMPDDCIFTPNADFCSPWQGKGGSD